MFKQGWLAGVAIQSPVCAFPIATIVCGRLRHYFNMTLMGAVWWILSLAGGGLIYAVYLIQKVIGGPPLNTVVMILLIYIIVIFGVSSACGVGFQIWRSTLWITQLNIHYFFAPCSICAKWTPDFATTRINIWPGGSPLAALLSAACHTTTGPQQDFRPRFEVGAFWSSPTW